MEIIEKRPTNDLYRLSKLSHVADVRASNDWEIEKQIANQPPETITQGAGKHFMTTMIVQPDAQGKLRYTIPAATPRDIKGQMLNNIQLAERRTVQRARMLKKLEARRATKLE